MSGTFVQSCGGITPTSLPNLAEGLNPEPPLGKSYPSLLSYARTDDTLLAINWAPLKCEALFVVKNVMILFFKHVLSYFISDS